MKVQTCEFRSAWPRKLTCTNEVDVSHTVRVLVFQLFTPSINKGKDETDKPPRACALGLAFEFGAPDTDQSWNFDTTTDIWTHRSRPPLGRTRATRCTAMASISVQPTTRRSTTIYASTGGRMTRVAHHSPRTSGLPRSLRPAAILGELQRP